MTPERLAEIRDWLKRQIAYNHSVVMTEAVVIISDLLAEVERLQRECDEQWRRIIGD